MMIGRRRAFVALLLCPYAFAALLRGGVVDLGENVVPTDVSPKHDVQALQMMWATSQYDEMQLVFSPLPACHRLRSDH